MSHQRKPGRRPRPRQARQRQAIRRRWQIGTAAAVVLVAALLLIRVNLDSGTDPAAATAGADEALAASFEMLDGGTGSFADYRGRPLVVNFFASWCTPCLAELPGIEQVHQDLRDQVAFLGINLQDDPTAGRQVVQTTGVTYDIARDPDGALFTSMGASAMPTTVLIDPNGGIVDVYSGEITADALRDRINQLLLS